MCVVHNHRYVQIGLMPRSIYGGSNGDASSDETAEKLPVFQRRDPAPADAGPSMAGKQAVMYVTDAHMHT